MGTPTTGKLAGLVKTGASRAPLRVLLYGPEGIGKTTWAAGASDAIFVGTEDGHGDLDVARLPAVEKWSDIGDAIMLLIEEPHDFRTLVIDTIDHLERKVWDRVCDDARVDTIEAVGGGYGKGYLTALEQFQRLAALLDRLRERRGMNVILLAHAVMEKVSNPEGPDYEKHTLKMHKKAAAFWKEWADAVLFAHMDVRVVSNDKGDKALLKKGKATGGDRVVETTATIAYDAKNRFGLPDSLPMEWVPFDRAIRFDAIDHRRGVGAPAQRATISTPDPLIQKRENARKALDAAGLLPEFCAVEGRPDFTRWTVEDLRDAQAALKAHAAESERPAEPTKQSPADVLAERRKKRVAECIEAGVLDAMRERHGDPDRWSHGALDKIKTELETLNATEGAP